MFDGVIGKYTDSFDENSAKKSDDMEIATKSPIPQRPRKSTVIMIRKFSFSHFNRCIHGIIHIGFDICLAGLGQRHLQMVLLFFGLFMAYTLRVNISVGIVAMVKSPANENSTHPVS